jgi:molecular chaperone GrpE (heat shock protein)
MNDSTPEGPATGPAPPPPTPPTSPALAVGQEFPTAVVGQARDQEIDVERMNTVLDKVFKAVAPPPGQDSGLTKANEHLEELAEDMLDVLRRVKALEQKHGDLLARLDQVGQQVHEGHRYLVRQLDALKQDLVGDRKELAAMAIFNAALPALDVLTVLRGELPGGEDTRLRNQMEAVIDTLNRMFRGLGFVEFLAEPGQAFDPHRMECLGYVEGKPGQVLAVVRPGYLACGTVVRPAGVKIADPNQSKRDSPLEKTP